MRKLTAAALAALAAISIVGCGKQPSAKEILDKAAAVYQKPKSVRVEAENSAEIRVDNEWRSNGSLVLTEFQRPDKVRQQTIGAPRPIVVSDGKKAYFYVDQAQSYIAVPPERVVSGLTSDQSGVHILRFMVDKNALKNPKNAKVTEESLGDISAYVVEFTPSSKPMPGMEKAKTTERLWIGKEDSKIYKAVLMSTQKNDGRQYTLTLTSTPRKQTFDAKLDAKEFALPKGAKVTQMPPMGGAPPRKP